ncbi:MAG: choline BCCT transporter BetT [Nocardioides sp.]|nr:choline BCCT transporter BetT [Nocardioides sp.]
MTNTLTPQPPPEVGPDEKPRLNRTVFFGAAIGTVAIALWAIIAPSSADSVLGSMVGWTSSWFGWFYVALATSVLVFVVYLALSRYGSTRLGPDHSRPEFSTLAWASMLFAAGIGTDLMYFAVAEPVMQFLTPPSGEPETVAAAREATTWTLFHYGITGWAMYALMGMALGFFAYRMNLPLAVRSALYPLLGKRVEGKVGDAVDLAAVLGTIFGVATTLGIGVVMVNVGLDVVFGVGQGLTAQIVLIVVGVVVAALSAVSGIDRGIKLLSLLNVFLAVGLTLFVLVAGRTEYLLNALVLNIGDFVRLFPELTMQTFAYEDTGTWMTDWTLFFWAWWIAWASFVGLFLARISRGRTIRQFVAGTLIIPFTYILMWVSIFGNSALDLVRSGGRAFGENTVAAPEEGFYALLEQYPAFGLVAALATLTALLFYVTSADSAALVMANLTSRLRNPQQDASAAPRIFWAVATGLLTIAMLSVGGIPALMSATVIMGLPFAFVMVAVMVGLMRALRTEAHRHDGVRAALPAAMSGRSSGQPGRGWQSRLSRALSFPTLARVDEHLRDKVEPALREVAAEVAGQGVEAVVRDGTDETGAPYVELRVDPASEREFSYQVHRHAVPVPAYAGRAPRGDDYYGRLEVHLVSGGQGYDVMDYTPNQLIDDVLDQYERHLEFLRLSMDPAPAT